MRHQKQSLCKSLCRHIASPLTVSTLSQQVWAIDTWQYNFTWKQYQNCGVLMLPRSHCKGNTSPVHVYKYFCTLRHCTNPASASALLSSQSRASNATGIAAAILHRDKMGWKWATTPHLLKAGLLLFRCRGEKRGTTRCEWGQMGLSPHLLYCKREGQERKGETPHAAICATLRFFRWNFSLTGPSSWFVWTEDWRATTPNYCLIITAIC